MNVQSSLVESVGTSAPALPQRPKRKVDPSAGLWGGIKRLFAFAWWLVTGFGLLGYLVSRKRPGKAEEIVIYCVPRSFFLWAIILAGFVTSAVVRLYPQHAETCGWVYLWVLLYTFVTLTFDVSTPKFLLWAGIFTFAWVVSKYLEDVRDMYLLSGAIDHVRDLHPALNPGF